MSASRDPRDTRIHENYRRALRVPLFDADRVNKYQSAPSPRAALARFPSTNERIPSALWPRPPPEIPPREKCAYNPRP